MTSTRAGKATSSSSTSRLSNGSREKDKDKDKHAASNEPPPKSLVVGEGVIFEGTTEGCAAAIIGGKLRGMVKTKRLEITKGGKMEGTAIVDAAEIAGTFEGNLAVANGLKVGGPHKVSARVAHAGS